VKECEKKKKSQQRPNQPGRHLWVENSFLCLGYFKKMVMRGNDKSPGADLETFSSVAGIAYEQL
jgi:hypothetical protein